ncbi:hypothetical protein Y032_0011g1297 [Ancylostoma ceylanicum]|uniref:Uncharacterized protein n=1 Tax=Ancylostoma ceylanicum TaxID=53326 RepID=A0A016VFV1_9BILA|nr:hypothetical protein Y032_0011g1297 [Ancylostoma ceylanicum]
MPEQTVRPARVTHQTKARYYNTFIFNCLLSLVAEVGGIGVRLDLKDCLTERLDEKGVEGTARLDENGDEGAVSACGV